MAAIRNSISLQDRMTPVFRSIMKSMDSTLRVMRNVDKQANKGTQSRAYRAAERDIRRANNEIVRMQNNLSRADKAAGKLATSTSRVSAGMANMKSGGFNLTNLASGLYLLKNIATTLNGIMSTPDTMNALQYRFETYDTTDYSGGELFDAAYGAAMRSRSDLASTASLATRILVSGATNGSGADSIDLAEILNKASFIGGSSSEESKRALLQLSQGLSSGVLQGDELRAIREQAPGLTDTLAKGLDSLAKRGALPEKFIGTTMGDLKQLGADGELTAGRVIAAFKEMRDYVDTAFENSPKQFGQAITGIVNVWKRWMKLMSSSDNAFGMITDKAWQLYEWFSSDSGSKFMQNLATGLNVVARVFTKLIDGVKSVISWFAQLDNSSQIIKSALIGVAVTVAAGATYMAGAWLVSFIKMAWPVLLVILLVATLVYALYELGYSTNEIVGGMCGAFAFLGILIYDVIIWVVNIIYWAAAIIWGVLVTLAMILDWIVATVVMIIILAIQGIIQIILWAASAVCAIFVTIYDVFYTIFMGLIGVIEYVIVGIYSGFVWMANKVLGVLHSIASAIDAIFGSNLAGAVNGWMKGLDASVVSLEATLDPDGTFEDIGDQWKSSYSDVGSLFTDTLNITGQMGEVWDYGTDFMTGVYDVGTSAYLDPTLLDDWAVSNTQNPMDGWNSGYKFGDDLATMASDSSINLENLGDIESMLGDLGANGVGTDGGDLDSVGAIKSDVDISDEDIQLLRDMAARDFLLNLQTVTPTANIQFGDVRETADVNKIMEVIQDMVDEELATSLVID